MKKVLFIEDEPGFQELLKAALEEANFEVILASDGKQGIIKAVNQKPDLIISDLIMPGMDGTTFLRHIRQIDNLSQIPIAILTVVPEGVPQSLQGEELFKNIIGYWAKDETTAGEVVKKITDYFEKSQ